MCIVAWNPWVREFSPASTDRSSAACRRGPAGRRAAARDEPTASGRALEGQEAIGGGPRFEGDSTASIDPVPRVFFDKARLSSRSAALLVSRGGVREQENFMIPHLDSSKLGPCPAGQAAPSHPAPPPARSRPDRRPGHDPGGLPIRSIQQLRELRFLRLPEADDRSSLPHRFGLLWLGRRERRPGRIRGPVDRGWTGDDRLPDVFDGTIIRLDPLDRAGRHPAVPRTGPQVQDGAPAQHIDLGVGRRQDEYDHETVLVPDRGPDRRSPDDAAGIPFGVRSGSGGRGGIPGCRKSPRPFAAPESAGRGDEFRGELPGPFGDRAGGEGRRGISLGSLGPSLGPRGLRTRPTSRSRNRPNRHPKWTPRPDRVRGRALPDSPRST